jgi:hypothetical protein
MKIFFRIVACAGLVVTACTSRAGSPGGTIPPSKPADPPQLAPTRTSEVVKPAGSVALASNGGGSFDSSVRPVLQAHCAPCHEPGGKMYERLPFDRGETIASHREGVLKRLKGDDRATVETWLASLPAQDSATAQR